jgi:cysteinyl-tRNA synthetase
MTAPFRIYNTRSRSLEEFSPLVPGKVAMYNCGPTVYNYAHIGNLRAFVFADILRRSLEWNGYAVQQVINITDVGHLVSDGDDGEDKMVVGATREGKSIEEIIAQYSNAFYDDLAALNVLAAANRGQETSFPRATHHIDEQIALIDQLHEKGYTYTTSDGIYFDTSKFPSYADFAHLDVAGMQAGARVLVGEKKHPTDFALWKFSPTDGVQREQEWDSPLGIDRKGFPGWHLECSAMAMKYLGETIDIHTGGIDHIPVHHTNEIAQSECATGKTFARYWMHSAFMNVDGQKMSKSLGNTYTLKDLAAHGVSPLAFRYWLLTAHYRTQVNFTWEALDGARNSLIRLENFVAGLGNDIGIPDQTYLSAFQSTISDDLNTANGIAQIWNLMKDESVLTSNKKATLLEMDKCLGLDLSRVKTSDTLLSDAPDEVHEAFRLRNEARLRKDFAESDRLRDEIARLGYNVKDTSDGQVLSKL